MASRGTFSRMEITVRSAAGARYEENGDDARESRMQKAGANSW